MFTNIRRAKVSNDRFPGPARMVKGSRIGVALFLFRATFSFSPSFHLIGEASKKRKKFPRVYVRARIDEIYSLL